MAEEMSRAKRFSKRQYGVGSFVRLPDGRVRAFVSCGKRLSKIFASRKEANAWARARIEEAERLKGGPGRQTLADLVRSWLARRKHKVSEATWQGYEQTVRTLLTVLPSLTVSDVGKTHIEEMAARLAEMKAPRTSARRAMLLLRYALSEAVADGVIQRNPAKLVKFRRDEFMPPPVWSADEAKRFLRVSDAHRWAALWRLALDSGMRESELLALRWPCVNFDRGTVLVERSFAWIGGQAKEKSPKSRKGTRTIQITADTLTLLNVHREKMQRAGLDVNRGLVFCNASGRWIRNSSIYDAFQILVRDAGLPKTRPHAMRHTMATLLLSHGVSPKLVSERLGHEDVMTTLRTYGHVLAGDHGVAVGMLSKLL